MIKPKKAHYNDKTGTSRLFFPWDDLTKTREDAEHYMRGGVCFPTAVTMPNGDIDVQGYIIMAGYNIDTGITTIFEEREFIVIQNILGQKGELDYEGLGQWLNKTWSKYFAKQYFFHQDHEMTKQYRLEIIRDQTIVPTPEFVKVPWDSDQEAQNIIWKNIKMKKIRYDKDGKIVEGLKKIKAGEKEVVPVVHALQCLLAGLERYPFRRY